MPRLEHILGAWMALVMAGCASSAPAPQATPVAGKDLPTQDAICAEWTAVCQQFCHDAPSDVARGGKQVTPELERAWLTKEDALLASFAGDHELTAGDLGAIIAAGERRQIEAQHGARRAQWLWIIGWVFSFTVLTALNLPLFLGLYPHPWESSADFFQVLQTALSYAPRRNWFTRQLNLYEEYDHVYTARGELWFFAAPLAGAVFMECLVLQYLLAWLTG